ncbi:MAG: orotate phosphoribosyltransferase [Rubrobacter sp.]|jgi:orotate phosphoribosyltransferase|nr:orotate phosphoribosyltransferase [Rubrobacter sp.]
MAPERKEQSLAERVAEAALLEGDFILSSGERSDFYVDKYLFSTEPGLLRDLASEIAASLPEGVDRLAGVELGAVPLAAAASLASGLPYVIVRKGAKEYGTAKNVEGNLEAGEKVVLIEDVVSTGTQAVAAAEKLVEGGVEVERIVAVLDRREGGVEGLLGAFEFRSLLKIGDLRVVKGD